MFWNGFILSEAEGLELPDKTYYQDDAV